MRVFLYHHAAAIPPSTAEAAAASPTLTQPDDDTGVILGTDEVTDSKEVAMSDNTFREGQAKKSGCLPACVLDAERQKND
ncbi:MAG: hypothetical protein ACRD19_07660 [Terriglobia bacterium]